MAIQLVSKRIPSAKITNRASRAGGGKGGSPCGRVLAGKLGARRRHAGIQAFSPRLLGVPWRPPESSSPNPPRRWFLDWRLHECDYSALNGQPAADLHRDRRDYLDLPYPDGESWRQAIARAGRFLPDLRLPWKGTRVLMIGHVATGWAFDRLLDGVALEELVMADFGWRAGWEYQIATAPI